MYKQPSIYLLTQEMLRDTVSFTQNIVLNTTNNYYWSDDFSPEFYVELAKKGFISTSYDTKGGLVLLPELQYEYAILDFDKLHISKKVQKLRNAKNYLFTQNQDFHEVLKELEIAHKDNWLKGQYKELLLKLFESNAKHDNFNLSSFELRCLRTNKLVAGEIGYTIGATYTSLSGFCLRDKIYNNYGNLQLVLLSEHLKEAGFSFWNLGHPHMEYKKKLGALVFSREKFLKRWNKATLLPIINHA